MVPGNGVWANVGAVWPSYKVEETAMKRTMLVGLLGLGMMVGGTVVAQNTDDTNATKKQLKTEQKADKSQAKADKAERKALGTKQQKKADKAQDKANRKAEKANAPQP